MFHRTWNRASAVARGQELLQPENSLSHPEISGSGRALSAPLPCNKMLFDQSQHRSGMVWELIQVLTENFFCFSRLVHFKKTEPFFQQQVHRAWSEITQEFPDAWFGNRTGKFGYNLPITECFYHRNAADIVTAGQVWIFINVNFRQRKLPPASMANFSRIGPSNTAREHTILPRNQPKREQSGNK
jgi:hypothetical protein